VIENASPEFSPLAPSTYMTAAQKVGRFFNAATGRAKPYTVADLLGLTQAGNEAYDAAAGFVNSTNPIRAYHGSPHTFDRFDMSKIGTGEGAQAYGHGLYFAGNEGVARAYKEALSPVGNGAATGATDAAGLASRALQTANGDPAKAIAALEYNLQISRAANGGVVAQDFATKVAEARRLLADPASRGSMYEVNLRTTPERLLDWDKPLSQQPAAVREAVGRVGLPDAYWAEQFANNPVLALGNIGHGYGGVATAARTPAGAEALRQAGIDGIQYLDAGSRAAGEGSRNYVMFRDDIIDILKRYGLLGMIGGGAATGNRLAPQGEQ
jgi:hypothetical protein